MVAKPLTECNIVFFFQMFLQGTPMSSTLLLVVSTQFLVRMQRSIVSPLILCCRCPPHYRRQDVFPMQSAQTAHRATRRLISLCVGASCVSSQHSRAQMSVHFAPQCAGVRDCAVFREPRPWMLSSSVSPCHTLNGTVFLKSVCRVNCRARCFFFLMMDVSWMFAHVCANQCLRTELHDVRRNVSLCGVIVLPGVAVIGSWCCGFKHVLRVNNMSDKRTCVVCLLFSAHDETQQSAHFSHHFKPRACLCLFLQCCAFSQSRTCSSKFVKFMLVVRPPTECNLRPSTWECAFPCFCFLFCLSFEKAQDRPHWKVHGMRCCIKYCGATLLVPTGNCL